MTSCSLLNCSPPTATTRRPQDALLHDMELPLRASFYPLGFPVEIVTNDPDVLLAAHESFGHRRLQYDLPSLQVKVGVSKISSDTPLCEPTRREYNHLYSLTADVENHAMLDLKTHASFAWLNRSAVENRPYLRYNFLEKMVYLQLGASVVTDIHAACVGRNGKGILLCGDSGAGKSTLSYACARAGWTYTSDDTSYLINASPAVRVIGHSHRLRFRPASKELFPELKPYELTPRMEGKPSLEILSSELPIASTADEATIHSIIYLNRGAFDHSKLILLPSGTATERTRQELFSAGEIRAKHEAILGVLTSIPTFELQYRDLEQAVERLGLLVEEL